MQAENTTIKPEYHLVAINETAYWNLDSAPFRSLLAGIETVYLYDATVRTFICSAEPHYWLVPIETREVMIEGAEDHPDYEEAREALNNWVLSNFSYDPDYFTVRMVKRLIEEGAPHYQSAAEFDGETDEERFEAAREYFQGNQPI